MPKPCAYNLTRADVVYRHDAFSAGFRAAGFQIGGGDPKGKPGDVLLIWNRYGPNHDLASRFEAAGGTVLVAENGYIAPGGESPHDMNPRTWFAIGLGAHNDSRAIREGGPERWAALGVDLRPWRVNGEHVLVCPNRSFGTPGRVMPADWDDSVKRRIERLTGRPARVRGHPGNKAPDKPLAEDLAGAWAMIIWHSSAGVHALVAGIPVICAGPAWIAKDATGAALESIENPAMPVRFPVMERLAWGQWSIDEIASGSAFRYLVP